VDLEQYRKSRALNKNNQNHNLTDDTSEHRSSRNNAPDASKESIAGATEAMARAEPGLGRRNL
jgi:hypothetical protein